MNAHHHISGPLLVAYAAGTLDEAYSLVIACHLSLCDQCRAEADALDVLGGSMIDALPAADVGQDALDAVFARIEAGAADAAPAPRRGPSRTIFPGPLQDYAGEGPDGVQWTPVGGGIRQAILKTGGEATARLLYIPAGKGVPDHGHRGLELTLVLQGSFSDEVDRFARGDVEIGEPGLDHQPVADPGDDCICLAATDAPLKFSGFVPRLFQRFANI